jgi:hypothetical protein
MCVEQNAFSVSLITTIIIKNSIHALFYIYISNFVILTNIDNIQS